MAILSTLKKLEKSLGRDVVRRELEQVAFEWDAPHWPEACLFCRISPLRGDWDYCEKSYYNLLIRIINVQTISLVPVMISIYCRLW
jgi:hypothetical protein